jgi:hypothetical protein
MNFSKIIIFTFNDSNSRLEQVEKIRNTLAGEQISLSIHHMNGDSVEIGTDRNYYFFRGFLSLQYFPMSGSNKDLHKDILRLLDWECEILREKVLVDFVSILAITEEYNCSNFS